MTVTTKDQAYAEAFKMTPYDYDYDECKSSNAGYPIFVDRIGNWICDLGNRIEINTTDGKTLNIWIEPIPESEFNEMFEYIDEFMYQMEDKISLKARKTFGINEILNNLDDVFQLGLQQIKDQNPNSPILKKYRW